MSFRTPEQIQAFLDANLHRFDVPVQYLGDEPNSYQKPWDSSTVRMLCYAAWPYEQSSGNQAIPLVYRTVNEHREQFLCDRSYFPSTKRDMEILEGGDLPIFGIESKHQMLDFDIVGSSVSYQVLTINVIRQLMMSGIPPTWADRHDHVNDRTVPGRSRDPEKWPMVMVGGQGYGAPEMLANVADVWFCGEVEDEPGNPGLGAVLDRVEAFKAEGRWKTDRISCYADLQREFSFLYFPRFYDVHYQYEEERVSVGAVLHDHIGDPPPGWENRKLQPSKQVVGITSNLEGAPFPIVKRFVKDLDAVPGLTNPPLLYVEPGMGSGDLETQRGCPAWCNFCALTYRQKPYRQREVQTMVDMGKELLQNTGGIHLAPFGPDFPMHTQRKKLISRLSSEVVDDIDASSMRVDDFIADKDYILLSAQAGMDSITLGLEGNSQRMRDLVGKGTADEDVKEALARAIAAGIKKVKLYMIAFLPGEEKGDIYRLLNLAKELADIRDSMGAKTLIQLSWTPMLIEANTPFQWFGPTIPNYALGDVWEELRKLRIDFKLGSKGQKDKVLYFQLVQRASREQGMAMVEAVCDRAEGSWGGVPRGLYEDVERALEWHGFLNGKADAYDERDKDDMFGWEHIDQGINVELMYVTFRQMREFLENTDADTYDEQFSESYRGNEWIARCDTKCMGKLCGVCDKDDLKLRRKYIQGAIDEAQVGVKDVRVIDQRSISAKVRAQVVVAPAKRFVMTDHWRYALRRAANQAGLPITKRTVRFVSDAVKFKDWTCGADYVEFGLLKRVKQADLDRLMPEVNKVLGPDFQVAQWKLYPASADPLRYDIENSLYEVEIDVDPTTVLQAIERWKAEDFVKMVFKVKTQREGIKTEVVNGKDFVDDLWLVRDGHRLLLRALVRGKASPYNVYAALLGKASWLEAARNPAFRLDAFVETDPDQVDFFRPACEECGVTIPVTPLDNPFTYDHCPKCRDEVEGRILKLEVAA